MILAPLGPWPAGWSHLKPHGFNLIEADPPWRFDHYSEAGWDKSAEGQYETMATEEIQALPVGELADVNCLFLLWTRAPMLDVGIDTLKAYGFKFATWLHWRKVSRKGRQLMGTGHRVRSMGELVLIGTKGEPQHKPLKGNLDGIRRRHSEKPEEFYAHVEAQCPRLTRRVILFSRRSRTGWETTGNQKTLFDGETAHDPVRRIGDASPCPRGPETMLDVQREGPRGRGSPRDRHRDRNAALPLLLPLDRAM